MVQFGAKAPHLFKAIASSHGRIVEWRTQYGFVGHSTGDVYDWGVPLGFRVRSFVKGEFDDVGDWGESEKEAFLHAFGNHAARNPYDLFCEPILYLAKVSEVPPKRTNCLHLGKFGGGDFLFVLSVICLVGHCEVPYLSKFSNI